MENHNILSHSYLVGLSGFVLSTEEKTNLHSSLLLLKNSSQCYRVVFWGKILGIKNDYHIAQGFRESVLGKRITFYSLDNGVTWHQLSSEVKPDDIPYLQSVKCSFMGDPAHLYVFERRKEPAKQQSSPNDASETKKKKNVQDEDEEEEEEEEEEPELTEEELAEKKKKDLEATWYRVSEESRLSYIIQAIDRDTSVVPRGAFILNSREDIVPNQTFSGLDRHSSGKLVNYIHLRDPEKMSLKSILEKEHLSKTMDFADTIDEDVPNRSWSLQYEDAYNVVVGRSLLWPGYVFFHVPQSSTYGSFYIGNGVKNTDLCFML